jgi:hypothetical protein
MLTFVSDSVGEHNPLHRVYNYCMARHELRYYTALSWFCKRRMLATSASFLVALKLDVDELVANCQAMGNVLKKWETGMGRQR